MNRPVWLRVALQVGIALLLMVAALPLPCITGRLIDSVGFQQQSIDRLLSELQAVGGLLLFAFGGLATLLSWLVVRRPWDALGASAIIAIVSLVSALRSAVSHGARWSSLAETAVQTVLLFAGCALVAWLIQRLASERHAGAERAGLD
jgi:VIT1/CCC1 family predicted Fe2+/Mn2+ transporter